MRLPRSYVALQALLFAAMVLCVLAAWSTLRTSSERATAGSHGWLILLIPLALAASFAHSNWLLRTAGFRPFDVPSTGMQPTILNGDRIIADLRKYGESKAEPHDIVVFRKDGLFFVKRVVAVGGTTVEGKKGAVFLNGSRLEEPYIQHIGGAPTELDDFGPVQIPPGKLFVLGDNRDVSRDSRMQDFGLIDEADVTAKALYVIRSTWKRIGIDLRWASHHE
jgi:signal peptidase I